jgi:putative oxidoreductase
MRVVIGLLLAGHGGQKLFGWFGGHGVEGTGGFFHSLGFRPGKQFAIVAGSSEFVGGSLFAVGFFTPFAAAAIVGVMFNAVAAVHAKNGPWVTNGGWEYPVVIATVAAGVAFTGAGAASFDHLFGADMSGTQWGIGAVALGLLAGVITDLYRRVTSRQPQLRDRDIHATA